jgi:hypothetical protein
VAWHPMTTDNKSCLGAVPDEIVVVIGGTNTTDGVAARLRCEHVQRPGCPAMVNGSVGMAGGVVA